MAETEKGEKGGKGVNVSAGKLAINMQKRLTRAQEKVMQKLGKADETRDTAFEEGVSNFNKQMVEGAKLQKDLKAYLLAVKTMHEASKRLQDCLAEMYEPDWFGKEEVDSIAEDTDMLWIDFHQKLVDSAIINLDSYMAQFPEIKNRIAKRDRKLVDFDSARHHVASLQKGKKKDEVKIAKAEEELGRAQKVFEELNVELQDELPTLWNSRVGLYVTTFQSMAGVTEKFHKEMGKLSQNLNDVMGKLEDQRNIKKDSKTPAKSEAASNHNTESDTIPKSPPKSRRPSGPPVPRPPRPSPSREMPPPQDNTPDLFGDAASVPMPTPSPTPEVTVTAPSPAPSWGSWQAEQPPAPEHQHQQWDQEATTPPQQDHYNLPAQEYQQPGWDDQTQPSWDDQGTQGHSVEQTWDDPGQGQAYEEQSWDDQQAAGQDYTQASWGDPGDEYEAELGASGAAEDNAVTNGASDSGDLPPGVLYKVKALHDYAATDGDELEMKSGEVVFVVPFDAPDEQDEGWLLGVKESHWLANKNLSARGVFPENFTQRC
ncbi:myc box-dependent-interacting protein 1b isoform X3 [Alosa alosa]|uniref:myc box-dependent-interacting protein 1b isoform X3 n=1 Tax=Alosa alosa TaxID=278164 RepID=UPI0020154BA9|nr:myc box-dependent-interacting protein 1b isoform X3 [Alosa alosa]